MEVLYRDSAVLGFRKAMGMSSEEALSEAKKAFGNDLRLIHRLDQPVSGVMLAAYSQKVAAILSKELQTNKIDRVYLAVCERNRDVKPGVWRDTILFNKKTNRSFVAEAEDQCSGKEARLNARRIGETDRYDAWLFELFSGRHHQIRCQCSARGIPIVGDIKYGARRTRRGGGIYLQALYFAFTHPQTGQRLALHSPPEKDPLWNQAFQFYRRESVSVGW